MSARPVEGPGRGRREPRYRELADVLRQQIRDRRFGAADRLPTEAELAERFHVSRYTVRGAYNELLADGLISRTPGRGTFIAPPGQYLSSAGSFNDLVGLSVDTEMEIVEPLCQVTDTEAAGHLGLETDTVMRIVTRRFHQGRPFSVTSISLPLEIGQLLKRTRSLRHRGRRMNETVLGELDRLLPNRIRAVRQSVHASTATRAVAEQIDCGEGVPILVIERLYLDDQGRPVELAVNQFHPDRYRYEAELRRVR